MSASTEIMPTPVITITNPDASTVTVTETKDNDAAHVNIETTTPTVAADTAAEADAQGVDQVAEEVAADKQPKKRANKKLVTTVKGPKTIKDNFKENHGTFLDENNIRVPRRKIRVSNLYYCWGVKHGEPIDITAKPPVCMTHFTAAGAARIFMVRCLRDDNKVTGRRDIYLQERGVNGIKTFGYVVTRRRSDKVKDVHFKKNQADAKQANFSIGSTEKRYFLNKKNLKSFRQQIMSQAGLPQEEIDLVETEVDAPIKDTLGNVREMVESDMDSGEDIPPNVKKTDIVDPEDDEDENDKVKINAN